MMHSRTLTRVLNSVSRVVKDAIAYTTARSVDYAGHISVMSKVTDSIYAAEDVRSTVRKVTLTRHWRF